MLRQQAGSYQQQEQTQELRQQAGSYPRQERKRCRASALQMCHATSRIGSTTWPAGGTPAFPGCPCRRQERKRCRASALQK
jgi:hypothetical protein